MLSITLLFSLALPPWEQAPQKAALPWEQSTVVASLSPKTTLPWEKISPPAAVAIKASLPPVDPFTETNKRQEATNAVTPAPLPPAAPAQPPSAKSAIQCQCSPLCICGCQLGYPCTCHSLPVPARQPAGPIQQPVFFQAPGKR